MITPTLISIMGRWFPKKNRGALVGLWSTCNNVGHIIGIQSAAALMKYYTPHWGYLMETVAGILFFIAGLLWLLLVTDPKYLGITVNELQGKEIRLHKLES